MLSTDSTQKRSDAWRVPKSVGRACVLGIALPVAVVGTLLQSIGFFAVVAVSKSQD